MIKLLLRFLPPKSLSFSSVATSWITIEFEIEKCSATARRYSLGDDVISFSFFSRTLSAIKGLNECEWKWRDEKKKHKSIVFSEKRQESR